MNTNIIIAIAIVLIVALIYYTRDMNGGEGIRGFFLSGSPQHFTPIPRDHPSHARWVE